MAIAVIAVIGVFFRGMGIYALAAPAAHDASRSGSRSGSLRRDRRSAPSTADSGSRSQGCWRTRPSRLGTSGRAS